MLGQHITPPSAYRQCVANVHSALRLALVRSIPPTDLRPSTSELRRILSPLLRLLLLSLDLHTRVLACHIITTAFGFPEGIATPLPPTMQAQPFQAVPEMHPSRCNLSHCLSVLLRLPPEQLCLPPRRHSHHPCVLPCHLCMPLRLLPQRC